MDAKLTKEQADRIEREWMLTQAYVAPVIGMLVGAGIVVLAIPVVLFLTWS